MTSEPNDRQAGVCNQCGQSIEITAEGIRKPDAVVLCDRCYLSLLAPDHKAPDMEAVE